MPTQRKVRQARDEMRLHSPFSFCTYRVGTRLTCQPANHEWWSTRHLMGCRETHHNSSMHHERASAVFWSARIVSSKEQEEETMHMAKLILTLLILMSGPAGRQDLGSDALLIKVLGYRPQDHRFKLHYHQVLTVPWVILSTHDRLKHGILLKWIKVSAEGWNCKCKSGPLVENERHV